MIKTILKLLLLLNTIRFLKWNQIFNLFLFKIGKCYKLKPLSDFKFDSFKLSLILKPIVSNSNQNATEFTFLKRTIFFDNKISWNTTAVEKLWMYNLHYFDYLLNLCIKTSNDGFDLGKQIISDWIKNNPIGCVNGWEPYPISIRICNWVFFYSSYFNYFKSDSDFEKVFFKSLYQQMQFLQHRVENHIRANHLFVNLKALLFTAIFFENGKLINKHEKKFKKELTEQILADGGHYERSPMYHSLILMDILDVINLIKAVQKISIYNDEIKQHLEKLCQNILVPTVEKMANWLAIILQPDRQIPLIGDSAFNMMPVPDEILEYCTNLVDTPQKADDKEFATLKDSGYFIFRTKDQYLIFDGGELGVSYQPGHAHCDIFSYEYTYLGNRFIVDSGLGNYIVSDLRKNARSIYSHNTVVVNKMEQGEMWHAFRMGRRVKNIVVKSREGKVSGFYENNIKRKKSYKHTRTVTFQDEKFFVIDDKVEGKYLSSVASQVHFHPDVLVKEEYFGFVLTCKNVSIVIIIDKDSNTIEVKDWFYVPEYGIQHVNKMLDIKPKKMNRLGYIITPFDYFPDALNFFEKNIADV